MIHLAASAYEVVEEIVGANERILAIEIVIYNEGPSWLELAERAKLDAVSLALKAVEGDQGRRERRQISRGNVTAKHFNKFAEELPAGRLVGILSKVALTGGDSAHIPMMDFSCDPTPEHLQLARQLLKGIGEREGFLLESGRSYHYYGTRLLSNAAWVAFLGKCVLMPSLVDNRYVGHQLVDGHCVLRLSTSQRKPTVPEFVAKL